MRNRQEKEPGVLITLKDQASGYELDMEVWPWEKVHDMRWMLYDATEGQIFTGNSESAKLRGAALAKLWKAKASISCEVTPPPNPPPNIGELSAGAQWKTLASRLCF